ncbi:MAG: lectin-like protein [Planctomycetota bacterium]|jgi:hypothetical protein
MSRLDVRSFTRRRFRALALVVAIGLLAPLAGATDPVFNPETGNWYEWVPGNTSWAAAKTAAESKAFMGKQGHLVTVLSKKEADFLKTILPEGSSPWLGATDEETEGTWKWVTGEVFWIGGPGGSVQGGLYADWLPNQPDAFGFNEDWAYWPGLLGWNDQPATTPNPDGYVIEYDKGFKQPKGRPHQVCFYAKTENDDPSSEYGHGFLALIPKDQVPSGTPFKVVGKYPSGNVFGGPGRINDDATSKWGWKICYWITTEQYNAIALAIEADKLNPPTYDFIYDNCVDWIEGLAELAGIELPDSDTFEIGMPSTLAESLEDIGDCNLSGGGLVTKNTEEAAGTPPACIDWNALGVASLAHADPAALATSMELGVDDVALAPVTMAPDESLSWVLSGVDVAERLVTVDWGDGGPLEGQATAFSHVYGLEGTYAATLTVVDSEAVRRRSVSVDVVAGGGVPAPVQLSFAPPVPAVIVNPACPPAPDIPLLPFVEIGFALAGAQGEPYLTGDGTPSAGQRVTLTLTDALATSTTTLVIGFTPLLAPFKGGTLVPSPDVLILGLPTDGAGELELSSNWPPGVPSGFTIYFQHWIVDAAGPHNLSASNGLTATAP